MLVIADRCHTSPGFAVDARQFTSNSTCSYSHVHMQYTCTCTCMWYSAKRVRKVRKANNSISKNEWTVDYFIHLNLLPWWCRGGVPKPRCKIRQTHQRWSPLWGLFFSCPTFLFLGSLKSGVDDYHWPQTRFRRTVSFYAKNCFRLLLRQGSRTTIKFTQRRSLSARDWTASTPARALLYTTLHNEVESNEIRYRATGQNSR